MLREEKQSYEMELAQIRDKYEEETACLKESQAESLEELKEKHRVQQESARNAAEREKNQLLSVKTYIFYYGCSALIIFRYIMSFFFFLLY